MKFTVNGVPVPKMRPVFRREDGRAYTPKKTLDYEALVRDTAVDAMAGDDPFDGAVRLDVGMYFPIPTSWTKKKQSEALNGSLAHCTKPDGDNVYKSIADALIGVVYKDDGQITDGCFTKSYSEHPRVEILVERL